MPDQLKIEINGIAELKAKLEELGTSVADRASRKAVQAGAEVIRAAIAERAPVRLPETSGTALPLGALANDIVVKMPKTPKGNVTAIVTPDTLTSHVARFVEYGHRNVTGGRSRKLSNGKTKGPGKAIGFVPAHPFIRPAAEAAAVEAQQVMESTLREELAKASK